MIELRLRIIVDERGLNCAFSHQANKMNVAEKHLAETLIPQIKNFFKQAGEQLKREINGSRIRDDIIREVTGSPDFTNGSGKAGEGGEPEGADNIIPFSDSGTGKEAEVEGTPESQHEEGRSEPPG